MNTEDIRQQVLRIFDQVAGKKVACSNLNLFAEPNNYTPRDLAYVFLELRESMKLDINTVYYKFTDTTLDELIHIIEEIHQQNHGGR